MLEIGTISQFNPWWTTRQVPKLLLGGHKRPQLAWLQDNLERRLILLLYGLRRVGKTTLLYQTIQHLLSHEVDPTAILYFSFDDKSASPEEVVRLYEEVILKKKLVEAGRVYLVFDEIQKVADWQSKVKIIYDLQPNAKILLSGSASVSLQKESQESLAGRVQDFFLPPLSFAEYLEWRQIPVNWERPAVNQNSLGPAFMDYLRKGGFPEMVAEEQDEVIRNYLKNTVLERIIYRDLATEFGLKDLELLRLLVEMLVREPGMIVSVQRLARDLGRNKVTVSNYLHYLAYALLTREVRNLRAGFLVSSRKGKKIYPVSSAFCFAYREDFYSESFLPKVAEVVVAEVLGAKYYYRNAFEVDFVLKENEKILPVGVKFGAPDTSQLTKFLEKFRLPQGVLVSRDKFGSNDSKIKTLPWWWLALRPSLLSKDG